MKNHETLTTRNGRTNRVKNLVLEVNHIIFVLNIISHDNYRIKK
jgi:hypothetical protein